MSRAWDICADLISAGGMKRLGSLVESSFADTGIAYAF